MRKITDLEVSMVNGGFYTQGYDFNFVVGNTLTGLFLGTIFPGFAPALGLTTYIANPILATGALFGTYALARMGATMLDQALFAPTEIIVTSPMTA